MSFAAVSIVSLALSLSLPLSVSCDCLVTALFAL
jgi:hypothetical protein